MLPRLLCTLIFWILMTVLILGAIVLVIFVYVPLVVGKAIWLKVTGRFDEVTGSGAVDPEQRVNAHPGL